jgi:cytochrome c oxidase accessory protein FixG
LAARRVTAWILIAVFTLLPFVNIGHQPAILLDIGRRQFTFFGRTFLPTDTVILAVLLLGIVVSVFLITAVLGRVWCGWACPQTVYMEFVFRPLERFFDGPPGRGGSLGRKATAPRTIAKYVLYVLVSMALAHTFLSYFVGVANLRTWITRSPFEHPTSFAVMAVTTALMFADFAWFREQTCIVACPYGRLQSVLLDGNSLLVSYDPRRGEPRGHAHGAVHGHRPPDTASPVGDCVDCRLCVETCPTGIDIRDGMRMECIGCAQCIDACDAVMTKLKRPIGLVRYSSQLKIAGERGRLARPRLFIYSAVLVVIAGVFTALVSQTRGADVTLLRGLGVPFTELSNGEVANPVRVKITNRTHEPRTYRLTVFEGRPARFLDEGLTVTVQPTAATTRNLVLTAPARSFVRGKHKVGLRIMDDRQSNTDVEYEMLGPYSVSSSVVAGESAHAK